jgi:hypothetical protein
MTEDRVALLVLCWLLCRPERTGQARDAHKALEGLGVELLRGSGGRARVDGAFERLAASGGIAEAKRGWKASPDGERAALGFLGLAERPRGLTWAKVKTGHLVASRLGVPAASLKGKDGLRAAILSRSLGVGEPGRSSLAAVRDALAWQALGVAPGKPFSLRAVMGVLLGRRIGGERSWDVDEALAVLAAHAVSARRADVDELRAAIVHRWLEGPAPPPVQDFVTATLTAAEATSSGRFGDDKVFIAHVWRTYRERGGPLALDAFKERLVEANRERQLTLGRADLVEAMNPDDVRESETRHLGASFHFVRAPRKS